MVAGLVLTILLLDWLAMLFAEQILRRVGTSLQVFGVVLSVTQIALGLQVILQSLSMMGLIPPRGERDGQGHHSYRENTLRCLSGKMFDHTLHTWNALGDDACCRSAGDGLDSTPRCTNPSVTVTPKSNPQARCPRLLGPRCCAGWLRRRAQLHRASQQSPSGADRHG